MNEALAWLDRLVLVFAAAPLLLGAGTTAKAGYERHLIMVFWLGVSVRFLITGSYQGDFLLYGLAYFVVTLVSFVYRAREPRVGIKESRKP